MELKSSWRIVAPGEDPSKQFFWTTAELNPLVCEAGGQTCEGKAVVADRTQTLAKVRVALVGLHIVGVVQNHPEFIWATFEHVRNAPDLTNPTKFVPNDPVSKEDFTFYKANTPANACNLLNAENVQLTSQANHTLDPVTNVFRQFPLGGGDAQDVASVKSLNESVHKWLEPNSIWRNYRLIGSVWFKPGAKLEPNFTGASFQSLTTGSVQLANATLGTFDQLPGRNCFSCHNTSSQPEEARLLPPKNVNLSRILVRAVIQRNQMELAAVPSPIGVAVPRPLATFKEVQDLSNHFVSTNDVPIKRAPHRDFWNTMSYEQFTTGNIPNVSDPESGAPLRILIPEDSLHSNLIQALRGVGKLFDPNTGAIGRMPTGGPFMPDQQIRMIADWIDRGCPNPK